MGLGDGKVPILRLNPPPKALAPRNRLDITTDYMGMITLSFDFLSKTQSPCRRIFLLTANDENNGTPLRKLRSIAQKHGMELHHMELEGHSVEAGRKIGEQFVVPRDDAWAVWIWDDYPGMGFYTQMLKRGIDLLKENRLLLHASPRDKLLDELGIPVIGFSPITIGSVAAVEFCKKLRDGNDTTQTVLIPAETNSLP